VAWPSAVWADFISDTTDVVYLYQAELLAVALLGLVPALLVTPVWVAALESRLGGSRRGLAVLLAPLLPAVLVGLGLWAVSLLPSVRTGFVGEITVRPAVIRELIPWLTLGGGAFGLASYRRRLLCRLGVLAIAALVALAAVNAWVQVVSYRDASAQSLELCTWDLTGLAWRGPLAAGLALAGIAIGVARRSGRIAGLSRGTTLGAYVIAVGVVLWGHGYPEVWSVDSIETIRSARLTPEGHLLLVVRPVRGVRLAGRSEAVFLRRSGESELRAVSMRRCLDLGTWGPGWSLGLDLRRVSVVEPATLTERLGGCLARRVMIDAASGQTEVLSRVWLFAQGHRWLRPRLGPGRSWEICNDAGDLWGSTVDGRRFEMRLDGLHQADMDPIAEQGPRLTFLNHLCPDDQAGRGPHAACVVTLDLSSGELTRRHAPFTFYDRLNRARPERAGAFVVRTPFIGPKAEPVDYFEIDADGGVSHLDPCPELWCLPFWQKDGKARLVDPSPVIEAVARAIGASVSRNAREVDTLREVGGRPLVLDFCGDLVQLDPALTAAEVVSRKSWSVQWLDDSVLFCEEADGGQRVVRYWPESRRRDVLFSLPRGKTIRRP